MKTSLRIFYDGSRLAVAFLLMIMATGRAPQAVTYAAVSFAPSSSAEPHSTASAVSQSSDNSEIRNSGSDAKVTILFFGDSITAGYGLDMDQAFPAVIRDIAYSHGYQIEAVNAGVSGETSAGGLRRIDWVLQRPFDIFVLELGGNDGLRGLDPEHTKDNLQQIIDKVSQERSGVQFVLTGMEAPPNMGESYTSSFRNIFRELAETNDVIFMPFILEDVAGEPEYNQADGIHPTAEGHRIIADNLWDVLEPLLR